MLKAFSVSLVLCGKKAWSNSNNFSQSRAEVSLSSQKLLCKGHADFADDADGFSQTRAKVSQRVQRKEILLGFL
ncbi:MAG: hypothetical protein K0S32_1133 [Bacteroidetes bacterium]|jgi:hypothetical protein|nr:hypothetical protein [Bacteroidota bacterium]